MDDKEKKKMVLSKKELEKMKDLKRKELIRKIANKVADRNDEALRKLSKN